jgi:hypothetical protein
MTSPVWSAIGSAVGLVIGALLTGLVGPALKDRRDRSRERLNRSELLLAQYSEPLARAAYDLQSRLYNTLLQGYLKAYYGPDRIAETSTIWLLAQYLGWVEILRREVQLLDFGDVARTQSFQKHVLSIGEIVAADNIPDGCFRLSRAEQRAIGELMVIDRTVRGEVRSDCMGYAEFCERLSQDRFAQWFRQLRADVTSVAQSDSPVAGHPRLVRLQNVLLDLIIFLDRDSIRFPENRRQRVSAQH